ncbi:MAG: aminoacetone oxidase family FAD-binding enzyme, partial [Paracoccus sp. (in: a-proteobacteria)]
AGVEGGGIYALSAAIRDGASVEVDLAPDLDLAALAGRFQRPRGRLSLGNWLRRVLGDPVKVALLLEWGQPLPDGMDAAGWAARAKALPLRHDGPMGLERAISSAGGIRGSDLTRDLELTALPGVFAAGEMLDWEAPTGGYLLTGCLATGLLAGRAAAARLDQTKVVAPPG